MIKKLLSYIMCGIFAFSGLVGCRAEIDIPKPGRKIEIPIVEVAPPNPPVFLVDSPTTKPKFKVQHNTFFDNFRNSTVTVLTPHGFGIDGGQINYVGAGSVIGKDKNYYYILTARHVIEGDLESPCKNSKIATAITIDSERQYETKFITNLEKCSSVELDLALLKLPRSEYSFDHYLKLEEESLPYIGSSVFSIGSPMGESLTMGSGIITKYRKINNIIYVHTNVLTLPGCSGGPIINKEGKIVGMVQQAAGENFGFAISAKDIRSWLDMSGYEFLGK